MQFLASLAKLDSGACQVTCSRHFLWIPAQDTISQLYLADVHRKRLLQAALSDMPVDRLPAQAADAQLKDLLTSP